VRASEDGPLPHSFRSARGLPLDPSWIESVSPPPMALLARMAGTEELIASPWDEAARLLEAYQADAGSLDPGKRSFSQNAARALLQEKISWEQRSRCVVGASEAGPSSQPSFGFWEGEGGRYHGTSGARPPPVQPFRLAAKVCGRRLARTRRGSGWILVQVLGKVS